MTTHFRITAFALLALAACGDTTDDNSPVCVPEVPSACFCPTGAPGAKVCAADGLGFGACACLPDAATADATADVDASSATDATEPIDAAVDAVTAD